MNTADLKVKNEYLYTANIDYIKVRYNGHDKEGYSFTSVETGVTNHLEIEAVNSHIEEI